MYPNPPSYSLPNLTMDIITDILRRLPVKTLVRCKCLSKPFYRLIDSPDFINRHIKLSSLIEQLILFKHDKSLQFQLLDINTLDKVDEVDIPLVDLGETKLHFMEVIGSCDGLLALSDSFGTIILSNLSTRKHKILPTCYKNPADTFKYGFGRGAADFDDHKLVRVASRRGPKNTSLSVYSLKSGSWRKIVDFPSYLVFTEMASFVKGTLNWLCLETQPGAEEETYNILSFDLNNDNFFFTSLPNSFANHLILTVGGECLCLLEHARYEFDYSIWVMKEYGVKDSWIKMYSVSLPPGDYKPSSFAFTKHFDKLIFIKNYSEVVVLDLIKGTCEITKSKLLASSSGSSITFESLVSLGSAD